MHLLHEGMEMHAAFRRDGDGLEKEIHQHRLAAPDAAPDVKALGRRYRTAETEKSEGADLLAGRPFGKFIGEMLQMLRGMSLRRVLGDFAPRDLLAIDGQGTGAHAPP